MNQVWRSVVAIAAVWTLCAQGRTTAQTQAGAVIGTGVFTAFVENMDRSLAFYHDVFGMEVPPLPASGERPYNNANPRLFAMFDIPGARERHQSARVPGTRTTIELMEIQNVDHKTIDLRIQDPGNGHPGAPRPRHRRRTRPHHAGPRHRGDAGRKAGRRSLTARAPS